VFSNSKQQRLWCCHRSTDTVRVHLVHLTSVASAPGGCQPLDQASQLEPQIGSYSTTLTITIYYYSTRKQTHFTIPWRTEGSVSLSSR